jgi:glycerophosphoryl diester phosphodiesterase
MRPDFLVRGAPRILGHRGVRRASAPPENTLGAFEEAFREGAHGIECDVRLSADGDVIVLHDPDLERVTEGRETRAAHVLSTTALRNLDLGASARIPTLDEVLDLARATRGIVDIEIKHDVPDFGLAARAVAVAVKRFSDVPVMFSSFEPRNLIQVARAMPHVPRALIVHRSWYEPIARVVAARLGGGFCASRAVFVGADVARYPWVGVWTVNDPREAAALYDRGIDLLITDTPSDVVAALGETPRTAPR